MQNVWVRKTSSQYAVILKERYFSHCGFSHNHPQVLTWFCVCVLTQNSSLDLPHNKSFICMCACAQSCLTLCDPMDCSLPGSSVYGILQGRILEYSFLQGIFQTQGLNLGLPHCKQILYCLSCRRSSYPLLILYFSITLSFTMLLLLWKPSSSNMPGLIQPVYLH